VIGPFATLALATLLGGAVEPGARGGGDEVDLTAPRTTQRRVDASKVAVFGLKWREPVVQTGFFRTVGDSFGRPAISTRHGLVIVGTGEGVVRAVSLALGRPVWAYTHGAPFEASPTVVDGPNGVEMVVIASRDGRLLALSSADGKLLWKVELGAESRAVAVAAGDLLLVATAANRIAALEISSGKPVWNAGRPGPTGLTVVGHARPLVVGDTVIGAFSDGYVEAYARKDGTRRWSRPLSLRGADFVDADADPVGKGGRVFVASYSDGVYALDLKTGEPAWNRPAPAVKSLALIGDTLVAGSGDGWVWGLAADDGTPRYRTRVSHGLVTRMEAARGLVAFGGGDAGLVVLDGRTGRPLQASNYGSRMHGDPVWVRDDLVLLSSFGYLYCFGYGHRGRVQ